MKRASILSLAAAATVMAIVSLALTGGSPISAQRGPAAPAGQAAPAAAASAVPRMPDGHPDLSGVWWRGSDNTLRPLESTPAAAPAGRGAPAPAPARGAAPQRAATFQSLYKPEAAAKRATLGDKDDPTLGCIPVAFGTLNVSLFNVGFVGQILQTPKFVVMLSETFHGFRLVPIDGRPHRDDAPPGYRGDSIGRWDGDVLVVDQTNFTDTNWMFAEGNVSFHSDALHIVERYRRVDANTLEIEATVEDPKVLTAPWVVPKQTLRLAPFDQIMEVGCSGTETKSLMDAAAKENYGKK